MGTSKNSTFGGPLKTAQMLGARPRATGAYPEVREDRERGGQHRRWAVFRGPHIFIIDRSLLATNMYQLLFSSLKAGLFFAQRFQDALGWWPQKTRPATDIDLAVINSNVFGKNFPLVYEQLEKERGWQLLSKIFLCRASENEWKRLLLQLPRSTVAERPFHPDKFLALIQRVIK